MLEENMFLLAEQKLFFSLAHADYVEHAKEKSFCSRVYFLSYTVILHESAFAIY